MLRAARALLLIEGHLSSLSTASGAAFSTAVKPPTPAPPPPAPPPAPPPPPPKRDYGLVMTTAKELTKTENGPGIGQVGITSGAPAYIFERKVRIYSPGRGCSQSGYANTNHKSSQAGGWKFEFESAGKWENQLMGWTSTADPLEYVARASLAFHTKEDAISFAKKHGWQFEVDEPHERKTKRTVYNNAYSDNFSTKRKGVPDMSNLRGLQK